MIRPSLRCAALAASLFGAVTGASAETLLIHDATVHTGTAAGALEHADVLIRDGRIAQVGSGLSAPAGAQTIDAGGRPLTAGLFAGISALGLEEINLEPSTIDNAIAFASQEPAGTIEWRPEFDVLPAYNPDSAVIGVNRVEGLTWTVLAPLALPGGSFVAGQGEAVVLDGRFDAELAGSKSLFVDLGSDAAPLSGGSRAGQFMLLEQAIAEAKSADDDEHSLLTPLGRRALAGYLSGGRVVFEVDRAVDIHRVLQLARRVGVKPVIAGGGEAWRVADELAAARVPVLLDPLEDLPDSFDQIGARLDNAAKLHAAGVTVGFIRRDDPTANARKIRQAAGVAVANGLPWQAGLAAITSVPAAVFGQADRGTIAAGQVADLVLWSGDPLEVTSWADQVWIGGEPQPMQSRQSELFERYRRAPAP